MMEAGDEKHLQFINIKCSEAADEKATNGGEGEEGRREKECAPNERHEGRKTYEG